MNALQETTQQPDPLKAVLGSIRSGSTLVLRPSGGGHYTASIINTPDIHSATRIRGIGITPQIALQELNAELVRRQFSPAPDDGGDL